MGIKGIKKLIESNEGLFLANCELQGIALVIDGPNLLHYLFTTIGDLDFLHGGDYNEFASVIRDFFHSPIMPRSPTSCYGWRSFHR